MAEKKKKETKSPMPTEEWLRKRNILRENLNIPGLGPFEIVNKDLPPIERAPQFRRPTPMYGMSSEQARGVEELYKLAPQLRGRASALYGNYGPHMMDLLLDQYWRQKESKHPFIRDWASDATLDYLKYPSSQIDVYGATSLEPKQPWTHPSNARPWIEIMRPDEFMDTLAHEYQHVNDMLQKKPPTELTARPTGSLAQDVFINLLPSHLRRKYSRYGD